MSSYAELTPESAQNEKSDFLVKALNDCKPESGAHLVAKNELTYRASRRALRQKLLYTVIGGVIGFVLGVLAAVAKGLIA